MQNQAYNKVIFLRKLYCRTRKLIENCIIQAKCLIAMYWKEVEKSPIVQWINNMSFCLSMERITYILKCKVSLFENIWNPFISFISCSYFCNITKEGGRSKNQITWFFYHLQPQFIIKLSVIIHLLFLLNYLFLFYDLYPRYAWLVSLTSLIVWCFELTCAFFLSFFPFFLLIVVFLLVLLICREI